MKSLAPEWRKNMLDEWNDGEEDRPAVRPHRVRDSVAGSRFSVRIVGTDIEEKIRVYANGECEANYADPDWERLNREIFFI